MQANSSTGSVDLPATGLGHYAATTSRLSTYGHHSVMSLLQLLRTRNNSLAREMAWHLHCH